MDLSIFGHINIDEFLKVPKIPEFGSVNVLEHYRFLGGTAANIAKISAMLGLKVELFSVIGLRFPKTFLKILTKLGVNTENVIISKNYPYGPVCYIVSDGTHQVAYMDQGPMANMKSTLSLLKKPVGKWIHFATGDPEYYLNILKKYKFKKSSIVFDPGQELTYRYSSAQFLKFLKTADITILNEREFNYAKKLIGDEQKLKSLSKCLIITRGEKGCTCLSTETVDVPVVHPVFTNDTTGAGDAFRAGFYYGLNTTNDVIQACHIANKVAGIVIKSGIYNIRARSLSQQL